MAENGGALDPRVERATDDPLVDQDSDRVSQEVLAQPPEGWTWRPGYITPQVGTVVSLAPDQGFSLQIDLATDKQTEAEIKAKVVEWLKKSLPYLARHDDTYLGGWISDKTQRLYLDVSERYADHNLALKLGKERNQEAVFRLTDMTTHETGGTGK